MEEETSACTGDNGTVSFVKIATWNVLAQAYCLPERYEHSPAGWAEKEARIERITSIVDALVHDADAVCLQEVDDDILAAIELRRPGVTHAAMHHHRRDGVAVLSRHQSMSRHTLAAGAMQAVAIQIDVDGAPLLAVSTHLEWSETGAKGAAQLEALVHQLQHTDEPTIAVGMDANGSWAGPVCAPMRQTGWSACGAPDTALVSGKGWQPLDVIAVNKEALISVDVQGRSDIIPSNSWPSDHCVLVASIHSAQM